ncbi:helix-turn-helix domain-containing protein [Gracilibacillus sp. YIM 98692]|uniref:helix-turn-helix domain-containing protein n=1 Tax=Gracilibacillus sp. YIM 98692 TaxID=2663532 RepID=UPI0013D6F9D1|nr:helix-turn-helix domain-containing protein [Gracilibacillus sp. YIM 98692]
MINIGKTIKHYRKSRQYTQKDLAEKLHKSNSLISKIESGCHHPTDHMLHQISKLLHAPELDPYSTDHRTLAKQLSQWDKAIARRKVGKADKLYQEMKEQFPITHAMNTNTTYHLYQFRYSLLKNDLEKAEELLPQMINFSSTLSDSPAYLCCKVIGLYYITINDFRQAKYYLYHAKKEYPHRYQQDPELNLYLAMLYHKTSRYSDSLEHAQFALRQYQEVLDSSNIIRCRKILSSNDMMQNKCERANRNLLNILYQYPQEHHPSIYALLGEAFLLLKQKDKALKYARKAIHYEKCQSQKVSHIYLTAIIYQSKEDYSQALAYIQTGQSLHANLKFQHKLYILEMKIHNQIGTPHCVERLELEIYPYFVKVGDMVAAKEVCLVLSNIYSKKQHYKKANDYLKRVVDDRIAEGWTSYLARGSDG